MLYCKKKGQYLRFILIVNMYVSLFMENKRRALLKVDETVQ